MQATVQYEKLLMRLDASKQDAVRIEQALKTLPTEYQERAAANLGRLANMQTLVANFARLEARRLEALQGIALARMTTQGNA